MLVLAEKSSKELCDIYTSSKMHESTNRGHNKKWELWKEPCGNSVVEKDNNLKEKLT